MSSAHIIRHAMVEAGIKPVDAVDYGAAGLTDLLESAPAHVYAEVESEDEHQEFESQASVIVTWLHSGPDAATPGHLLRSTLAGLSLPSGDGRVFVACEAGVMREIRRHLLHERKLAREQVYTHGYWKQGAANHPDHDLGDDV